MNATDALIAAIPSHSADLAYDLAKVLGETRLTATRRWGVALATAVSLRDERLTAAFESDARAAGVGEATLEDARAAASLMAMTNVYYRFVHVLGGPYERLPAALRMKRSARPAGSRDDFELFTVAVSAVNGCEACMRHHETKARGLGVEAAELNDAIRLASAVTGASLALWQGE